MAQVTGIVKIYLNGSLQRSKEGASLVLGGYEKTPQSGHSLYGFSKKFQPAEVEFTMSHMADTDLIALRDLEDTTLKFETDTGLSYVVTGATLTTSPKLTGGEGDVEVTMQGNPAVEE
jgi:hypothetical protein